MVRSLLPLLVALAGVALVAASGLREASLAGTPLEDRFHGFFLDRYPLFAALLLYGAARVGAMAQTTPWRLAGAVVGVALVLVAGLYPTFGGIVLRAGFATGGMSFLTGQRFAAAYALGSAATALVFATVLGLGVTLARGRLRMGRGPGRAVLRAAVRFAALWWAAAVLGAARWSGLDDWPRGPLHAAGAGLAAGLVAAALAPHALLGLLDARPPVDRPRASR